LVRLLKKAKGGFTHIFIVVDKSTRWIKAKPTASIIAAKVVEFIFEIMYWFGMPNNGLNLLRVSSETSTKTQE
jgi:hypothetical protein